jgi:hypothetical protein
MRKAGEKRGGPGVVHLKEGTALTTRRSDLSASMCLWPVGQDNGL